MKIYLNEQLIQVAITEKFMELMTVMKKKGLELNRELYETKFKFNQEEFDKVLRECSDETAVQNWSPEFGEKAVKLFEDTVSLAKELDYSVMEVKEILDIINFTEEEIVAMAFSAKNLDDGKEG